MLSAHHDADEHADREEDREQDRRRGAATAPAAVGEPGNLVVYFDQLHLTAINSKRLVDELTAFPVMQAMYLAELDRLRSAPDEGGNRGNAGRNRPVE